MNPIPAGFESDDSELDLLISNLKITRLQHITTGAGLNGQDFNNTLPSDVQNFFESIRNKWNSCHRGPHLLHDLKSVLLKSDQPLLLALQLFANCPECENVKTKSFAYFILDSICKIYREHPYIADSCEDNTRMVAFNFVKMTGILALNKAVIEAYQLRQISDLLLPKVRELLALGHYKDGAQWAIHLGLTHKFDMMELVFPLIAQDKLNLAEDFLDTATHQRLPLVKFLDSLLHREKSVIEICEPILERYKNLSVSHNVLSYRPMSKLVARLAKKYKFDESITPNYKYTKTCSYLHYLYREYQKGAMSVDAYRELVRDNATNKSLQIDIVTYIATIGEYAEALLWYETFQLTLDECPAELQHMISNPTGSPSKLYSSSTSNEHNTSVSSANEEDFLTLDLSNECIELVDTNDKFNEMLSCLTTEQILYFDSEWRQYVCTKNLLCLLQIAVTDRVYLIDCLASNLDADLWRALGANVFNNVNILKVGFSMQQDLIVLQRSLPLQLKLQIPNQYLDLRTLWQHLKKLPNTLVLPHGNVKQVGDALNDLSLVCLGKKLNKSNQCSNWANRPLRYDQVLYAALDARCLLLIYETLAESLPLSSGLKMDVEIEKVITMESKSLLKRIGSSK